MQKKVIVAALAAAFALPGSALADDAALMFYGKINVDVESVKSDKVAAPATDATGLNRVQSNASRFGFKGSENLGGGLQTVYQFETQIDTVNDKNAKTPFNGVRNSQIGLKGGFGTIFAGNWDSPYKVAHNKIELFDNTTVFTTNALVGVTGNGKSYVTRQNNVIEYMSPNMGGLSVQAAYSMDSSKTATTNKTTTSVAGMYENDMLYAALAYETRSDQTTVGKSDNATRLVAALKFPNGLIGATLERMSVANTASTTASQTNSELVGMYSIGMTNLGIAYAKNGDYNGVSNTGANQLSLRYGYSFTKATELYAAYTSISNGSATTGYGFNASAPTVSPTRGVGAKQTGLGLGLIHSF
jgi:predicted porin